MALQPVSFGDGSALQVLTSSANLKFDAAANNLLLGSPASTFGVGVTSSAFIGGDSNNIAAGSRHVIDGGNSNSITGVGSESCTIDGGSGNSISSTGVWNSITNGNGNVISGAGNEGAISGGGNNTISASGNGNQISGAFGCTISGTSGESNIASGVTSTINDSTSSFIAGTNCVADGANFITLFGHNAKSTAAGTFVFCDSSLALSTLTTANSAAIYATNGAVIADTINVQPATSSILTLSSTTKCFRPPVVTTGQKNAIATPPTGGQVFDTTLGLPAFYNGAAWTSPAAASTTFSASIAFSGPWAALTHNVNVYGERIGNIVVLWFGGVTDAANATGLISTSSGVIPVGFRPTFNTAQDMVVIQDTGAASGSILIDNTGGLTIGMNYANPANGIIYENSVFQNLGQVGFPLTCVPYVIAG